MAEKILMLALSPTMETGTIVKWNKKEGESFSSGDMLCEVETDKATMDYESPTDGTLLKIIAHEGAQAKIGDPIAISGAPGEDFRPILAEISSHGVAVPPFTAEREEKKETAGGALQAPPLPVETGTSQEEHFPGGVKASPLARRVAKERGIDIRSIKGSGPGGRIIKEDVEKAVTEKKPEIAAHRPHLRPARGVFEKTTVVSEKQKIIAKRLSGSMFSAPHFYLTVSVAMDTLLAARQEYNQSSGTRISFNAYLMKFTAEAIGRHPLFNSTWRGDTILTHESIDIALAVAQKDGLITPVVRDCGSKGILSIDEELGDLISRAREGKLAPEEYTGGSFTISSLGSYGVRQFTAIINPPESAILAVGEIFKEPVVKRDGTFGVQQTCLLTLSCDHRVIDGARAAEFARDLKNMMEKPITVLLY